MDWSNGYYQFAAMIGLPSGLTFFDFGFILIFGIEDLFFFFWSSRPMIASSERDELVAVDLLVVLSPKFSNFPTFFAGRKI